MKPLNHNEISLVSGGINIEHKLKQAQQDIQSLSSPELAGVAAVSGLEAIMLGKVFKLPVWSQILMVGVGSALNSSMYVNYIKPELKNRGWVK